MKKTLLLLLSLMALNVFSQDIDRVSINGRIIVASGEKEGVTVFNSSSNKGTITDKNGDFQIKVITNDVVEFGALLFKDFTVTITDDIVESKQLTVILVEEINKLDEVVLLPFGLTGNLNADLENVRTHNVSLDAIYFGLDNMDDFEFSADYKTEGDNLAFNDYNPTVDNMINFVNLAGFLVSQVVDMDKDGSKKNEKKVIKKTPFKEALDKYSVNYIHANFNIPLDQVDAFTDYIEEQGVDEELLAKDKELQFLEHITQLSASFLKMQSDKN